MAPLVVARRADQLGGRLGAMVNARCLAERFDLPFAFVWRRGVSAELDEPSELLGPELLRHEIAGEALAGRPSLRDGEIGGRNEAETRRRLAELEGDAFVDVVENFGIADYGEERDAAVPRFRPTFRSPRGSPEAQRLPPRRGGGRGRRGGPPRAPRHR